MTKTRRPAHARRRGLVAVLFAASVLLPVLGWTLPRAEATDIYNYELSMKASYGSGSREDTGVGEARPTLPEPPSGMESPQLDGSTAFVFELSCNNPDADCAGIDAPIEVSWDFGDGTRIRGGMVETHAYRTPGIYTVRATAVSGAWYGEALRTVYVSPRWADIINVQTYAEVIRSDGPILYWRLNDGDEASVVVDSSGNGRAGTPTGPVTLGVVGALESGTNTAALFADTGAITVNSDLGFSGNATAAVEAWVRFDGSNADQQVLLLGGESGIRWDRTVAGQIRVSVLGEAGGSVSGSLSEGWNHVVFVWNPGLVGGNPGQLYINGSHVGAITDGEVDLDGTFVLGGNLVGGLDEVVVYASGLSTPRVQAHFEAGEKNRLAEARADRESIWMTGALGLVEACRTATPADGADGLEVGRAMFCPEPNPTRALQNYLDAAGPISIPKSGGKAVNGITGEDCLSWWGACNLPKEAFDAPIESETNNVNVTLLTSSGKLDEDDGSLIYDPLNCGDGWVLIRNASGDWELQPGSEDGCVTKGLWYDMLIKAVDGHLAKKTGNENHRNAVPRDDTTCLDFLTGKPRESFALRRAIALGIADGLDERVGGKGFGSYCDVNRAITKGEAFRSLARVLGVEPGGCVEQFRDLADPSLGSNIGEDPDCGLVAAGADRGVPLVGDLNCYWGDPEEEGICANLYDPLYRVNGATMATGIIAKETQIHGVLSLQLSQDGPKPVGSTITITATGRAPITTWGSLTFTFPAGPPGTNRQCGDAFGRIVVDDVQEVGGLREATVACQYTFEVEAETILTVRLQDSFGNFIDEDISISGVNEPPQAPAPSNMVTINEGAGAEGATIFTSADPNGQSVTFELARDENSPFSGVNGPTGPYNGAVMADSPQAYWRLTEVNGAVVDSSGNGAAGTVVGTVTRGAAGALTGSADPAYLFGGAGRIEASSVAANPTGPTTVEFWMFWNGGDDEVIVAFEDGRWFGIFEGFIGFADGVSIAENGEGFVYGAKTVGLPGRWVHVVAEFADDIDESTLYIDGVSQNLEPVLHPKLALDTPSTVGGPGVVIGSAPDGSYGYVGRLDEIAVYHGDLNQTRRRARTELARREVVVADEDGRDVARLQLEQVTSTSARVTVRPLTADTNGTYTFRIRATDGEKYSDPTLVSGIITPTNDAPIVAAGVISNEAMEGGDDAYGTLYGADPNDHGWDNYSSTILTYRITAGPEEGTLYYDSQPGAGTTWTEYEGGVIDIDNPLLRYTPAEGPYGDGYWSVTYQVLDNGHPTPGSWSAPRDAYFYIINSNDPPTCLEVLASTDEDTPKNIEFLCSDPDEDELTYEVLSGPLNATLSGDGDSRLFTPNLNWCGETTYTYRAFDGELYSETKTVEVEVTCINDAPTAPTPDTVPAFNEDATTSRTFTTTDPDGGPNWTFEVSADGDTWSAVSVAVQTTNGEPNGQVTLSVNQGDPDDKQANVNVQPSSNVCGDYTFYVRAFDGELYSPATEVTGTVTCLNDPPTQPSPSTMPTVNEDTNAVQTFTTTDVDGGPQWTFWVSDSSGDGFRTTSRGITGGIVSIDQGSLTDKSASITFTPNANWCGNYTFYVRVFDGVAYSPVRTVTGTITCVNDAPTTPTINSSWGTQVEESGNVSITHGSGATRAWQRTYTTTDVDTSGTGSNRWCMQVQAWDNSWQPSNVSNCPSGATQTWVETAVHRVGSTNYAWALVEQGNLTNKTANLRIVTRPNWTGDISVRVRFCDDGGLCSGTHTQTLKVTHYKDHVMVVDYASGNFRWRESKPIGAGLSNSNQWATANLNGTHRSQPVVGDWNGDGLDDRSVLHKASDDNTGNWVFNSEFGTNLAPYWNVQVPNNTSGNGNSRKGAQVRAFAGDWDGDGDDDYAVWSNLTGRVWLLNNGNGASTCWGLPVAPPAYHWSSGCSNAASSPYEMVQGHSPAGGDANGDGRDEVFLYDVYRNSADHDNRGMWQIRNSTNGSYAVTPFWFGPQCDYTSGNWMEHCFAVVGDWDGNGTETVGVFLRAAFSSHPINRFFYSNNFSGTLAGQHDFQNGSQQSTYMGVFGYDRP